MQANLDASLGFAKRAGRTLKVIGNALLAVCTLLAGGLLWLPSSLGQKADATVWLLASGIAIIGIVIRYVLNFEKET
jgi:hypothetical protein